MKLDRQQTAWLVFGASVALALGSLLPWLHVLPGLHSDEAWVGLRVFDISRGKRPLMGMNDYTGPFHSYVSALFMNAGTRGVFSLRLSGVALNVAGLYFAFEACRRTFGATSAALYALMLASLPAFALYSRMATEITGAVFFLAAVSAYALSRRTPRWDVIAGLALSVGVWTHVISLAVVSACIAVAVLTRASWRRWARVAAGLVPFAIFRLLIKAPTRDGGRSRGAEMFDEAIGGLVERVQMWPGLLAECIHGDVLFMRHVGRVDHPTLPIFALLVGAGMLGCLVFAFRRSVRGRQSRALLGAFFAAFATAGVMSPHTSDRYVLLSIYLAPLFVAYWLPRLTSPARSHVLALAVAIPLCLFQQGRTALNFHAAHRATGGGVHEYPFGDLTEKSSHFVRNDRLYRALVKRRVKKIYGSGFITRPLDFYDRLQKGRMRFAKASEAPRRLGPDEVFIDYAGRTRSFKNAEADSSVRHFTLYQGRED